jgi:hypothetical protein
MSTQAKSPGGAGAAALEQRVGRLEGQVGALIDAVEVLARGFEDAPMAAKLLLLVKAARQETPGG